MVVVTIIISFFSIAFGEMVPKRIAMQKPDMWARMALGTVKAISLVFAPMMWLLDVTTNGTLKLLGMKTKADDGAASEEDIRLMVENSGEQGAIAQEEQQWIENVFDFGDMVASDVMTPEPDVTAFSIDETPENIIQAIQETGLSRYPVYEEDINDICGVLNARDFLLNLQAKNPKPIKGLLRRAYFVPESVHADQLFKDMQSQKHHFAIVVDEYGGTAGVVTMEDLLEEIVGNIYDEFDPEEPQPIVQVKEGLWRVQGSARVEELADVADIEHPGGRGLRHPGRHGDELPVHHPRGRLQAHCGDQRPAGAGGEDRGPESDLGLRAEAPPGKAPGKGRQGQGENKRAPGAVSPLEPAAGRRRPRRPVSCPKARRQARPPPLDRGRGCIPPQDPNRAAGTPAACFMSQSTAQARPPPLDRGREL